MRRLETSLCLGGGVTSQLSLVLLIRLVYKKVETVEMVYLYWKTGDYSYGMQERLLMCLEVERFGKLPADCATA